MPATPDNRRRQPRFMVEGLQGKMVFASQVEIANMSLSGVALRVDRRLNIGAEYALKLEVEDRTVSVKGVVVWSTLSEIRKGSRGEDVAVYSAGMKFSDVLSQRLTEILAFIDGNKLVQEKRLGGLRFHIDAPGRALLDYPQSYHVKVISMSGMLIETPEGLDLEERCPMEMFLEDGTSLRFSGRVAFCSEISEDGRSRYQVGVEFVEMASADRERLAELIRSLAGH